MKSWTDEVEQREAECRGCGIRFTYVNRNPALWCPACRKGNSARRRLLLKEREYASRA